MAAARAQTPISGGINTDTTLTLANSPYLVQSTVTVSSGATLTIQPGVELRFASGDNSLSIFSDSKLVAEGTAAQPIRFTAATAAPLKGEWRGLFLDGQASLNFCDIGFTGWPNENAVRVRHSATTVRNTTVHDSAGNGIYLDQAGSTPTFENVTLSNNAGAAMFFNTPEHSPVLKNLTAQGNGQNGISIGLGVNVNSTLPSGGLPYFIRSAITVGNGANLTIRPGVEFRFAPGDTYISVFSDSKLTAEGTAAQPIKFTSANAAPGKGDWRGLFLDGQSSLNFCDVGFGGWNNEHAIRIRHSGTAVRNTTIHDSGNIGIYLDQPGSTPTFENVKFTNNAGPGMQFNTPEQSPSLSGLSMEGNGQNGISIGQGVNLNIALPAAGVPYFVRSAITVGNGATWTIQPGAELRFAPGDTYITVFGDSKLTAEGTVGQPIKFTAANAAPGKGDWRGLFLDGQASLNFCDVGFGGWNNEHAIRIRHSATSVRNTTVHDSANIGIYLDQPGSTPTFENVTFSNNAGAAMFFNTPEHSPTIKNLIMTGNSPDGISIAGGVNLSISLPAAGVPYFVRSAITVGNGSTWTIQPGAELRFNPGDTYITVFSDSRLAANGTTGFPVRFTSANPTPGKGDWRGLFLDGTVEFDHCDIGFGGWPNEHAIRLRQSNTTIRNSTIHDSANIGVYLDSAGSTPTFEGVAFKNNAGAAILFNTPEHTPVFKNLVMEGNTPNGVSIAGGVNLNSVLPPAGYPYFVRGAITVGNGSTWTIQPGAELRFNPGDTYITVFGDSRLVAEGGVGTPIRFTSASASPQPGDWRGLFLDGSATLAYCDIDFGGWPGEQAVRIANSGVRIQNSLIHHSPNNGVTVINGARPVLTGSQIEQNGFGVANTDPNNLVNAVLNWWGDANGPKHPSNPFFSTTTGLGVTDGVLFDPWIGKREEAGPLAAAPLRPSFLPWPLFTIDPARVDANGQALAVWRDVLPAQGQGSTTGLTLPMAFAGVEFALDWKAGDHATLAGDAAGTQQFCVDGTWTLTLAGPTPVSQSGDGCATPFDLASLNLAEGTYGGQILLNIPAGATHYGASNVFFLSAAHEFREANIPARKSGIHFQADPVAIPVGTVGAVPVRLTATPRPFNGVISHFALDPKAALVEEFKVPAGWTGGGGGTLDGIFREYSNAGPLKVGEVAFTMQVRCLQPGNWPMSFEGNGFGLGATNDPSQSLAYLQTVAEVLTIGCTEALPVATATPLGASVDHNDGTLFVNVAGTGFNGANKAELRDGDALVATSVGVQPASNGGSLVAHFGVVPAGTYTLKVLGGGGNEIANAGGTLVPPSMPLFSVEQGDQLAQLPGKAVAHFWRVRNHGTADGVAIVQFAFPAFIQPEPTLVKTALPQGSLLLTHGALPGGEGWIETVAVPVKAGSFASVSFTFTVPPDAVFGSNPAINSGEYFGPLTSVMGAPTMPEWLSMLDQLAAGGTLDARAGAALAVKLGAANQHLAVGRLAAMSTASYNAYLGGLSATQPELAPRLEPYVALEIAGLLDPGAAGLLRARKPVPLNAEPQQDTPEPEVTNSGIPGISQEDLEKGQQVKEYLEKAAEVYKLYKDCGFARATKSLIKDKVWSELESLSKGSPHTQVLWFAVKAGISVGHGLTANFVNQGFTNYETARAKFLEGSGLDPNQPLSAEQLQRFMQLLEESPGEYGLTFVGLNNINIAISYLTTGNAEREEVVDPAKRLLAFQAMEFAHMMQAAKKEKEKQGGGLAGWLNWAFGINVGKPPIPSPQDNDPCPEKIRVVTSYDPNDISVDPIGVPDKNWTRGVPTLRYVIHFENLPNALAAAEDVRVTARLDPNLDASTLQFDGSSFDAAQFAFDPVSRMMTWSLPGINLVPNTAPPNGEGWVAFTVSPKPYLPTGTPIREVANVYFDFNPPIVTPNLLTTLDVTPPASHVNPLGETQPFSSFGVQWAGADPGSGVMDYTVYVSENGGSFRTWLTNTPATEATFDGAPGSTYAFYATARDRVGNVEESPAGPDAVTKAGGTEIPDGLGDVNNDGSVDVLDAILVLKHIVGVETLTGDQQSRADMNKDSLIDVIDAIKILRKAVGLPF